MVIRISTNEEPVSYYPTKTGAFSRYPTEHQQVMNMLTDINNNLLKIIELLEKQKG
jgi:hypothetical protein